MNHLPVYPEWEAFEEVMPPPISWRRARQALATATTRDQFVTIESWQVQKYAPRPSKENTSVRARWMYGWRNNQARIDRLRTTKPHGFDLDGDPWYTAVLYPAPADPIHGFDQLVGAVSWVGHLGCVWPSYGELVLPLVQALERRSRYFLAPVIIGRTGATGGDRLFTLLPSLSQVQALRDQMGDA